MLPADFLERFDIIALLAMGAPQTPPLKTHLMSFTSKGAIFREVKISKIRARLCTLNLAFSNSISGLYRLRWSVRPGSGPPRGTPCQPPLPRNPMVVLMCTYMYVYVHIPLYTAVRVHVQRTAVVRGTVQQSSYTHPLELTHTTGS